MDYKLPIPQSRVEAAGKTGQCQKVGEVWKTFHHKNRIINHTPGHITHIYCSCKQIKLKHWSYNYLPQAQSSLYNTCIAEILFQCFGMDSVKYSPLRINHQGLEYIQSLILLCLACLLPQVLRLFWTITLFSTNKSTTVCGISITAKSIVNQSKSIADGFNLFFVSIGNKVAECFLYESENPVNVIAACQSSFTLGSITSEFVSKTVNQLKSNKATGLDKI